MTSNRILLLTFGTPAAGKSTALLLISKNIKNFEYINTGELARFEQSINSKIGQKITQVEKERCNFPCDLLGELVISKLNPYQKA